MFRGRAGSLVKIIWHDDLGMSLYAKRLEKGRFIWPSATDGAVSLTDSQLACLLDGIEVINERRTSAVLDDPFAPNRNAHAAFRAPLPAKSSGPSDAD